MITDWNGIRSKAYAFCERWKEASREKAEAQLFWAEFLGVFGIDALLRVIFEYPVMNLKGKYDSIDLFWEGKLLVEHKSRGVKLSKAESQAFTYIQQLASTKDREKIPRFVLLSDFAQFVLYDLVTSGQELCEAGELPKDEFPLAELPNHVEKFRFLLDADQYSFIDQEDINITAVALLGDVHDALEDSGYRKDHLDKYMVRILFCLFAEDTGIIEDHAFARLLETTHENGSTVGGMLHQVFEILDTPEELRQRNLPNEFAGLPYVDGRLFSGALTTPYFNKEMRQTLLRCTHFDWRAISPAIFGALFQSIMEPRERRQYGAHYTSERDILRVIKPLFLDDLLDELRRVRTSKRKLEQFHRKLGELRFLDPACGCGNFLVVTYRELRRLEIDVLLTLYPDRQRVFDIRGLSVVDVDQFYGIELEEWPARIASVALWLMDHIMNMRLSQAFGQYYLRLPLSKSPTIRNDNSLLVDWSDILAASRCSYVLGNPPFVGKHLMTSEQSAEMDQIWDDVQSAGVLDYVTAWYRKSAEYIGGTRIRVAGCPHEPEPSRPVFRRTQEYQEHGECFCARNESDKTGSHSLGRCEYRAVTPLETQAPGVYHRWHGKPQPDEVKAALRRSNHHHPGREPNDEQAADELRLGGDADLPRTWRGLPCVGCGR